MFVLSLEVILLTTSDLVKPSCGAILRTLPRGEIPYCGTLGPKCTAIHHLSSIVCVTILEGAATIWQMLRVTALQRGISVGEGGAREKNEYTDKSTGLPHAQPCERKCLDVGEGCARRITPHCARISRYENSKSAVIGVPIRLPRGVLR